MKASLLLLFTIFLTACGGSGGDSGGGDLFSSTGEQINNRFAVQTDTAKTYVVGEHIDFTLIHEANISVSGTPRLSLNVGGATRYAEYLSGNNTRNLTFRYTVLNGDNDTDGLELNTSIDLNGGSMQYSTNGNLIDANLTLPPANTSALLVQTSITPNVIAISDLGGISFNETDPLSITVSFDVAVDVVGTPQLELQLNSGNITLDYLSGSGGDDLVFTTTVAASDYDSDGVILNNTINLNGGSINASTGAEAAQLDLSGLLPDLSGVRINTEAYQLAFTAQPNNADLNAVITPAVVVEIQDRQGNIVSSSDSISLVLKTDPSGSATLNGTTTISATNGSASFNSLSINRIANGFTLEAQSGGLAVAESDPFNILPLAASQLVFKTQPANSTAGSNIANIEVEFQDIYGNTVTAENSNITLSFSNDASLGSATLGGTLTQAAVAGSASFSDINIDKAFSGYTLQATSGALNVVSTSFDILPGVKSQLVFAQQPVSAEQDTPINITVEIQDAFGNLTNDTDNITLSIANDAGPGATLGGTTNISATAGSASFSDISLDFVGTGYTLQASASGVTTATSNAFNILPKPTSLEIVTQPTNGLINSNLATIAVEIRDASGNLINNATNSVTVSIANDPSTNAVLAGTTTLNATSGIANFSDLQINNAGVGYTLQFSSTGLTSATSNSFDLYEPAVITSIDNPADKTYLVGEDLDFTVNFDRAVDVVGIPEITLAFNSGNTTAQYVSGSGTNSLVFRHTVVLNELDSDGIDVNSPITGGTITDQLYNAPVDRTFTNFNIPGVLIDGVQTVITSYSGPANGNYDTGATLIYTFTFSDTVTVSGTPRLALTFDSGTVYADYVSGSATTDLVFHYDIQNVDEELVGVTVNSPLDLNGGSITDSSLEDAILTFTPVGNTVRVNSLKAPEISQIPNQVLDKNVASGPISFTFTDVNESLACSVITVQSSNTTLIPVSNVVIAGTAPNCTVNITPATNEIGGPAFITLAATDSDSMTGNMIFSVNVSAPDLEIHYDFNTSTQLGYNSANSGSANNAENFLVSYDSERGGVGVFTTNSYLQPEGYKGITGTAARTIAFWVKGTTLGELVEYGNTSSNGSRVRIYYNSGQNRLFMDMNGNNKYVTSNIQDNNWHHLAFAFPENGSLNDIDIYIDGVVQSFNGGSTNPFNTASGIDLIVGRSAMTMDDFKIFGRELSATEIADLATPPATNQPPVANAIVTPGSAIELIPTKVQLGYFDVDGDLATACSVSNPDKINIVGSCSCDASGVCSVDVRGDNPGTASFDYNVTANAEVSNTITATFTIEPEANAEVDMAFHFTFDSEFNLGNNEISSDGTNDGSFPFTTYSTERAGSGSFTNIGTVPGYKGVDTGSFSVSVWMKTTNTGPRIAEFGTNTTNQRIWIGLNNGRPRIDINGRRVTGPNGTTFNDNQWHHYAIVADGATTLGDIKYYVDGNLIPLTGNSTEILNTTLSQDFVIGNSAITLDEFRFYERAISNQELVTLSAPPVTGQPPIANGTLDSSTITINQTKIITLGYVDSDNDLATTCSVSNISAELELLQSCSCDGSGVCTVGFKGLSLGTANFDYQVTANSEDSNIRTAQIDVISDTTEGGLEIYYDFSNPNNLGANRATNNGSLDLTLTNVSYLAERDGAASFGEGFVTGYKGITDQNAFALSTWVKTPVGDGNVYIARWGDANGVAGTEAFLFFANGRLRFESNGRRVTGSFDFRDNDWHHVVIQVPAGAVTLGDVEAYVDGQIQVLTGNDTQSLNIPAVDDMQVGDTQDYDEFRLYSRLLSFDEIDALGAPVVLNQPPVASGNLNPNEISIDAQKIIELGYFDVDGDLATSCNVSNLSGEISLIQSCSCSLGICTIGIAGNSLGNASFDYTVTANSEVSETVSANIEVLPSTLDNNLLAHYTFNDTFHLGNNRLSIDGDKDLTIDTSASALLERGGAITLGEATAVDFKGVIGQNPFAVSTWIKTTNATMLISQWGALNGGIGEEARIQLASGRLRFETNGRRMTGSQTLNDNNWHHIVVQFPSGSTTLGDIEVYVDGNLEFISGNSTQTLNIISDFDLYLGGNAGNLDEFRIYSRALTLSEIEILAAPGVLNRPPVASGILSQAKALVNKPIEVLLGYSDVDSDQATLCTVTNLDSGLEALNSCACTSGVCSIILASSDLGSKSFDYSITANSETSELISTSLEFVGEADINSNLVFNFDFDIPTFLGDNKHSTNGDKDALVKGRLEHSLLNGGSARFRGSNAGLEVLDYQGISGSNERSIAMWVKTPTSTTGTIDLVRWGDESQTGSEFRLYLTNQMLRLETTGNFRINNDKRYLADGQWHHIVVQLPLGGSTMGDIKIFIDGKADTFTGSTTAVIDSNLVGNVLIGDTTDEVYFDDVRLYERALSFGEIEVLASPAALNVRPYALGRIYPETLILNEPSIVYLGYSDPDDQQASSCSLSNVDPSLTITTACTCDESGTCLVGLSSNSLGTVNFDYQVTTTANSNSITADVTTITAQTVTDGLVAHYDFDNSGNLLEDANNNLDAVLNNGVTSFNDGTRGLVAEFDGSSQIDLNNSPNFYSSEIHNRTWSFHVNFKSISEQYIIDDRGRNNRGFAIGLNSDGTISATAGDGTNITVTSTTTLSPSSWYHISAVYSGSNLYLYINGQLEDAASGSFFYIRNDGNSRSALGGRNNQSVQNRANSLDGYLDDVKVFQKALSDQEILQIYLTE